VLRSVGSVAREPEEAGCADRESLLIVAVAPLADV
jgi:hypothetical protein